MSIEGRSIACPQPAREGELYELLIPRALARRQATRGKMIFLIMRNIIFSFVYVFYLCFAARPLRTAAELH